MLQSSGFCGLQTYPASQPQVRSDFGSYVVETGPAVFVGAGQVVTSVILVVDTEIEVAVMVTGGTTEVVVVVKVEPLSVMVTNDVMVDPGNVVTDPGS